MAYSVAYGAKLYPHERWHQCTSLSPFEHWLAKGRPEDALLKYATHGNGDVIQVLLAPGSGPPTPGPSPGRDCCVCHALFDVNMDGYFLRAAVEMHVDLNSKLVRPTAVSCVGRDCWEAAGKFAGGGDVLAVQFAKQDIVHRIIASVLVDDLFGPGWTTATRCRTYRKCPPIDDGGALMKELGRRLQDGFGWCKCGPWSKAIGLFAPPQSNPTT